MLNILLTFEAGVLQHKMCILCKSIDDTLYTLVTTFEWRCKTNEEMNERGFDNFGKIIVWYWLFTTYSLPFITASYWISFVMLCQSKLDFLSISYLVFVNWYKSSTDWTLYWLNVSAETAKICLCFQWLMRRHTITWMTHSQLKLCTQRSVKYESKRNKFPSRKYIWKCRMYTGGHFVLVSMCWDIS